MQKAIITYTGDTASMNIRAHLLEEYEFVQNDEVFEGNPVYEFTDIKLYTLATEHIHAEHLDKKITSDLFCFATKHQSAAGKPSLTVHVQGNWSTAEHGGEEGSLGVAATSYMKLALEALRNRNTLEGYEVTMEATHHGPAMDTPSFFIEIGSHAEEWKNPEAGKIISDAIMDILPKDQSTQSVVVLGGGHYNAVANKIMERTEYAVGHICPKFALEYLTVELLGDAVQRSIPPSSLVVIDWKGLGPHKQHVLDILTEINIPVERAAHLLDR
ncbi:D-tyrosyl-tRNA(Tyr) deacylase [Candidatus Woesearchaeota archaeon]|nr:D-tyrosyl-tRNA(Tyr) deacylase [Candidatus Woesearchaeota archaeon]